MSAKAADGAAAGGAVAAACAAAQLAGNAVPAATAAVRFAHSRRFSIACLQIRLRAMLPAVERQRSPGVIETVFGSANWDWRRCSAEATESRSASGANDRRPGQGA